MNERAPELSDAAKAALSSYAQATRVTDRDRDTLFARLGASIEAGADDAFVAELHPGDATSAGWGSKMAWAGLGAAAAGLALWVFVAAGDWTNPAEAERSAGEAAAYEASEPDARTATAKAPPRQAVPNMGPTPEPPSGLVEPDATSKSKAGPEPDASSDPPTPIRRRPAAGSPAPQTPPKTAPEPAVKTTTLASELALMQQARSALRRKDFGSTLQVLRTHAEQFPKGQLREDRDALRVLTLCQSGEYERGREALRAFDSSFADSHHRARLEATCKEKSQAGDGTP